MKHPVRNRKFQANLNQVNKFVFLKKSIFFITFVDGDFSKVMVISLVIDKDAPSLRLCLRLPNGSKETISMNSSERIEVRQQLIIILIKIYYPI